MARRVYEVARALDLSTEEVMGRLNDAGVGVKSRFAVVEDPIYERVFGEASEDDGTGEATPNYRPEERGAEALPRRRQSPRKPSLYPRVLMYALIAVLAFVVAAGVGATAALMWRGDTAPPAQEEPRPSGQQGDAPEGRGADAAGSQQRRDSAGREEAASRQDEGDSQLGDADYASKVGEIQNKAVEAFLNSHNKLLRYDAITAEDVKELSANEAVLEETTAQTDDLAPPPKYDEQYEVISAAVEELHEATRLAHDMAADPVAAAEQGFDEYDEHVSKAEELLQRSNGMLGRDYETIEGVREISPQLSATEATRGSGEV